MQAISRANKITKMTITTTDIGSIPPEDGHPLEEDIAALAGRTLMQGIGTAKMPLSSLDQRTVIRGSKLLQKRLKDNIISSVEETWERVILAEKVIKLVCLYVYIFFW